MAKKLSAAAQWMIDHPNDEPPPSNDILAAREWRIKRGLDRGPWAAHNDARKQADLAKYKAAMKEKPHMFSQDWNIAFGKALDEIAWLIREAANPEYALARAKESLDEMVRKIPAPTLPKTTI
jgi:hypothetical protein